MTTITWPGNLFPLSTILRSSQRIYALKLPKPIHPRIHSNTPATSSPTEHHPPGPTTSTSSNSNSNTKQKQISSLQNLKHNINQEWSHPPHTKKKRRTSNTTDKPPLFNIHTNYQPVNPPSPSTSQNQLVLFWNAPDQLKNPKPSDF